ncbi:hypothetical protein LMF32_01060 [Desemzia sp. C1]|uniref:hypothetical protein n=1 Tax=Desemzia sp. C1 TaxID=2892016 RepID=UPI001E2D2956|nr:hypothetical protein [Desemzia sp. C1]MCI3027726.1 hypothetical protein [Desemzia sp. C1]
MHKKVERISPISKETKDKLFWSSQSHNYTKPNKTGKEFSKYLQEKERELEDARLKISEAIKEADENEKWC